MASRSPSRSISRSASTTSLPPRHDTPVIELSPADRAKEAVIRAACDQGDIDALVELATSSTGLLSDSLRRIACSTLR